MTYTTSCLPRVVNPLRMVATVLALLLSFVLLPGMLSAQVTDPVKTYSIPADDAAQSLKRFVEQAGVQLLYANEQVEGVRTQAVEGEFTATGALERLLRDTGLEVTRHERTGALAVKRAGDPNGAGAVAMTRQRPERNSTRVSEDGTLVLEEVEVVESRMDGIVNQGVIPTTPDAPFYFDVITRLDIERMGATNIEEVFRNTNQITTYSTANQEASVVQLVGPNNLATNAGMRGFDALQTTVLINGRRIARGAVPGLVGAASGDLSRIPVNAIERIEILPLSGSAMFGGGAIGGVINVILRKNYSGRELTARFGTSTEGGSTELSVAYLHGFSLNDGRTSGTFSFNYRDRGALSMYQRRNLLERAVERLPIETQISNFTSMPGVIRRSGGGDLGIPGAPGVRYASVPAGLSPAAANGLTPDSFVPNAGVFVPSFDRYKENYIYTPMKSLSVNFTGEHELFIDRLTLYGELQFTGTRQAIRNSKFFGAGNTYSMSATHPFNPFRTGVTPGFVGRPVVLNVFMEDARPNTTDMARDAYRMVLGTKGKISDRWDWSLDGTTEMTDIRGDSQVGADNINLATFFSTFTNPATFNQRWDIYNLLADHTIYSIDESVNEDYFNAVALQRYRQYASNLIARTTGDLYQWRAGPIQTSLGGELYWWQYEGGRDFAYPATLESILGGRTPRVIEPRQQGRRTESIFGELVVPVISRSWRPVPVQSLDLNFSSRYEATDDSKAATTTAAAIRLALTPDVAFRVSYSEGFFPPEQSDLHLADFNFAPEFTASLTVIDPRRGNVAQSYPGVSVTRGPNPDLKPETSTSWNYGLNLTPRFLPGFRFNFDMWHIEKVDAIRTPNYAQILENEQRFPDRVTRAEALPGDPAGWAGPIVGFNTTVINISSIETKGYDAQVRYHHQTDNWGDWTLSGNVTYTDYLRTAVTPTSQVTNSVGTNQGALQWRGRGSLFWEYGPWRAGVSMRYIDSYVTATTAPSPQFPTANGLDGPKISSDITWDLQVGYRIPYNTQAQGLRRAFSGTDWTLGAINVLNRLPPWYSSGFYSRYSDPRMRYVYLEAKKSF